MAVRRFSDKRCVTVTKSPFRQSSLALSARFAMIRCNYRTQDPDRAYEAALPSSLGG